MSPASALPPWQVSQANQQQLEQLVARLEHAVSSTEEAEAAWLARIPVTAEEMKLVRGKEKLLARLATARTRLETAPWDAAHKPTYSAQYPSLERQLEAIDLDESGPSGGPPSVQFFSGRYEKQGNEPATFKHFSSAAKISKQPLLRGPNYMAPTQQYLAQAHRPTSECHAPQPLLLILDLNGALGKRAKSGNRNFSPRPGLQAFMKWLNNPTFDESVTVQYGHTHRGFKANIKVMIWTSARQVNCDKMVNFILNYEREYKAGFIAQWAREKFNLPAQDFNKKVQVYKNLEVIWSDQSIQQSHPHYEYGGCWDQTNTLILDDSEEKAASQPFNLINIPEFDSGRRESELEFQIGECVLAQAARYIQHAMHYEDVSTWVRQNSFRDGFEMPKEAGDDGGVAL